MNDTSQPIVVARLTEHSERAVRRHKRHPEEIDEIRRLSDNEAKEAISFLKNMKVEMPIDPNSSPDNSPLSLTKSQVEDEVGGYEIYKDERRKFQQVKSQLQTLTTEHRTLATQHQTLAELVHANENSVRERISKLETKVDNMLDYMAGPCLRTFLEVTFKEKMGLADSKDFDFWKELNQSDEKIVKRKTEIELSIWLKMLRFIQDNPIARNDTIHNVKPTHSNLTESYRKLKDSMKDNDVKKTFGFLISDSS